MKRNVSKYYLVKLCESFRPHYPIIVLYLQGLGLSYTEIGYLWAAMGAAMFVLEVPSGIFCDLFGRRITVMVGFACLTAGLFTLGTCHGFAGAALGMVVWGAGNSLRSGAAESLVYESLKAIAAEAAYMKVRSRLVLAESVSMAVAMIAGGYLYTVHERLPWLVAGTASLAGGLLLCTLKEPREAARARRTYALRSHWQHLRQGLAIASRDRVVRWLILFNMITFFPSLVFNDLIRQPFLVDVGYGPAALGWVFAGAMALSGLVSSQTHRLAGRLGEAATIRLIVFLPVVNYALGGAVPALTGLLVVALAQIELDAKDVVLDAHLNHNLASRHRGTVLSLQAWGIGLVQTLLVAPCAMIADRYSLGALLYCLAACLLVTTVPMLWRRPALKRGPEDGGSSC